VDAADLGVLDEALQDVTTIETRGAGEGDSQGLGVLAGGGGGVSGRDLEHVIGEGSLEVPVDSRVGQEVIEEGTQSRELAGLDDLKERNDDGKSLADARLEADSMQGVTSELEEGSS
jgi:hypothetical protein